jgi:hypothetical protein
MVDDQVMGLEQGVTGKLICEVIGGRGFFKGEEKRKPLGRP